MDRLKFYLEDYEDDDEPYDEEAELDMMFDDEDRWEYENGDSYSG